MNKISKFTFCTLSAITLLGTSLSQTTLADAPAFCKDWRDTGLNRYIRWDRVQEHVLQNIDYSFRAHGTRNIDINQDDIYFYSDEDFYVGVDDISMWDGDAKMIYNFSQTGTQDIWITDEIDLGSPSVIYLCAKTEVHVQNKPTLNTLTAGETLMNIGTARFFTSGGSMSDFSKYSLQNKPLEYRWNVINSDTLTLIANFTTTTPYTKVDFDYGGEYLVTVVTFDGTFTSNSRNLYLSVIGPRDGGGGGGVEPSF